MATGKYKDWITEDGLSRLTAWARDGLTDEQIAHNCGINPATLYTWKSKYPEINKALKKGKEVVDIEVENALLRRALGYQYTEVTRERKLIKDPQTDEMVSKLITTKEVVKEVAPDTTAQIYWLNNRRPDRWRAKPSPANDDNGILIQLIAGLKDE